MVRISDTLDIPESELTFVTSRSSGPGGQNVNKVNTRVSLLWPLTDSPSVSETQRERLRERLPGRINKEGILQVSSQRHRTQLANKEAAVTRFAGLLAEALSEVAPRVPVRVPPSLDQKRVQEKRRRGRLKRERSDDFDPDE
jgi:ribosome-associated protein